MELPLLEDFFIGVVPVELLLNYGIDCDIVFFYLVVKKLIKEGKQNFFLE